MTTPRVEMTGLNAETTVLSAEMTGPTEIADFSERRNHRSVREDDETERRHDGTERRDDWPVCVLHRS